MRGDDQRTGNLFAYVNIEERIRYTKAHLQAIFDSSFTN